MKITLQSHEAGTFLIVSEDGRSKLIQTDTDFPGLAGSFGWPIKEGSCDHSNTDGTVDCPDCGAYVVEFIVKAIEYLDDHIGDSISDPGYFEDAGVTIIIGGGCLRGVYGPKTYRLIDCDNLSEEGLSQDEIDNLCDKVEYHYSETNSVE
ncbi:hypothetical protein KAR91_21230 [Candidatus Pacearchaeota archaeon]|nr:hypothetical protein [Candidatus Pacearchaeota archaeon]